MATKKELQLTQDLIAAAVSVNASNEDVNVNVEVDRDSVSVRISPYKLVGQPKWDWLFYPGYGPAYFSGEVFDEAAFLARCKIFMAEISKHLIQRDADGVPV